MPSSPKIDSCLFTHNYAFMGGALACVDGPEATITRNTFRENAADYYGAGIFLYYAAGTMANNVLAHNSALAGGGIANVSASPSITNNTIVSNRPSALHLESAVTDYFENVLPALIANNIIWSNEIYLSETAAPEEFDIRFNDIQGGWEGEGNIDQDPLFANPDAEDYHLKSQAGRWDPVGQRVGRGHGDQSVHRRRRPGLRFRRRAGIQRTASQPGRLRRDGAGEQVPRFVGDHRGIRRSTISDL